MVKNARLILGTTLISIGVLIGLAILVKTLAGPFWHTWFDNDQIAQAQHHIQSLENKLATLEKNQQYLLSAENASLPKADSVFKQQKILWISLKLQQKFWSGEPYAEEWAQLLALVPKTIQQDPTIMELSRSAPTGIMTKHKLRNILLGKSESKTKAAPPPSTFWDHLKSLVKVERAIPGALQEDGLMALDHHQLEEYIAHHPDYAWANIPLQELHKAHHLVVNFYKILDSLFLATEQS